jgi:hypothetical protein
MKKYSPEPEVVSASAKLSVGMTKANDGNRSLSSSRPIFELLKRERESTLLILKQLLRRLMLASTLMDRMLC